MPAPLAAALIGGGIAAASNIAGGILGSQQPKQGATFIGAPELDISPGLKIAEFMNLLDMGFYDPTPLLQASPLNQLIAEIQSSSAINTNQRHKLLKDLDMATRWWVDGNRDRYERIFIGDTARARTQAGGDKTLLNQAGDIIGGVARGTFDAGKFVGVLPPPGFSKIHDFLFGGPSGQGRTRTEMGVASHRFNILQRQIGSFGPYRTLEDLFAAEEAYQLRVAPMLASAQKAAAGNFQARLDMQGQVIDLLTNLPDASAQGIETLKQEEKARLLRDLNRNVDEQREDLLTLSNAGNFNPGRPLGDLEEFRARSTQDADLEALSRALALIGGQQTVAGNNLNLLMGGRAETFNQAQAIAAADQGFRGGVALQTPTVPFNAAAGTGVAAGGTSLGQGLFDFAMLQTIAGK